MVKIPYIEVSECYGCGNCVVICPEVFQMNEVGKFAQVVNSGADSEECILEAMFACPARCIRWTDE
jgi:ferredoxin